MMKKVLNINERILYIIESQANNNKKKFAETIGFAPQVISNIVSGRKSKPSFDVLNAIKSSFVNINSEWLLTGKGKMLKGDYQITSHSKALVSECLTNYSDTKSIPLIPLDAMAGYGTGSMQVMNYDAEHYIVPEFSELNVDFMIRVKGSSMYPKYNSGDIVACRKLPLDTFFQWNKVYVLDTIQGPMIKRIKKSEKEKCILCVSDNKNYDPFNLEISEIHSLAIVIGVIRLE